MPKLLKYSQKIIFGIATKSSEDVSFVSSYLVKGFPLK